jgi:hypothetical protein
MECEYGSVSVILRAERFTYVRCLRCDHVSGIRNERASLAL